MSLTPAGRTFLDDARAILKRTNDAIDRARQTDTKFTGTLHLGFIKGYEKTGLSDLLSDFHIQYPNVGLSLKRENVSELYDGVLNQSLDIVINIRYAVEDLNDVNQVVLRQYPLLAVMPAAHPLAHRSSISRSESKDYPLVDIKKNDSRYGETTTILKAFTNAGFLPDVKYVSDDIETSILAVAAGIGYALLPSYITDQLSMREKVIAVPLEGEEHEMTIIAAWHKENENPALQRFLKDCLYPAIENGRF